MSRPSTDIGFPFLQSTSAPVLTAVDNNLVARDDSDSVALLELSNEYVEDGPNRHHLLWTRGSRIFYTCRPPGPHDLPSLVGVEVSIDQVYPPWRETLQQAHRPLDASTFVKYSYATIVCKITDKMDAFAQINSEIDILERFPKSSHPNIAEYRGCLRWGDLIVGICLRKYPCSLEQLVEGEVGDEMRPPYDPELILSGIQSGLEFIHDLGLVHDDINPRNIMIDEGGRAVIIDFDTCRLIGAPSVGGTPGWATNPKIALIENDDYGLSLIRKFMRGEYSGDDLSPYDM